MVVIKIFRIQNCHFPCIPSSPSYASLSLTDLVFAIVVCDEPATFYHVGTVGPDYAYCSHHKL